MHLPLVVSGCESARAEPTLSIYKGVVEGVFENLTMSNRQGAPSLQIRRGRQSCPGLGTRWAVPFVAVILGALAVVRSATVVTCDGSHPANW